MQVYSIVFCAGNYCICCQSRSSLHPNARQQAEDASIAYLDSFLDPANDPEDLSTAQDDKLVCAVHVVITLAIIKQRYVLDSGSSSYASI